MPEQQLTSPHVVNLNEPNRTTEWIFRGMHCTGPLVTKTHELWWLACNEPATCNQDSFNLSPPRPQWTRSPLVQIMACRLFGTKPLPEPMLVYFQLYSWEQVSVKFESEFYPFHSRKCIWKCRLPKLWPFCPGGGWVKWNICGWQFCQRRQPLGSYCCKS